MTSEVARDATAAKAERLAETPVAGAVAGVLFAVIFSVSVSIMISTMAEVSADTGSWLATGGGQMRFALGLMPFAGLFFLWFMAVARERLGALEDQFFSTVFLGSGLLFLAMIFSASAQVGALLAAFGRDPAGFAGSPTFVYGRHVVGQIFGVYALRMAGIFLVSQATLWLRTGVMPRVMAIVTYPVALVLLFVYAQSPWAILIFPVWVFVVSIYILLVTLSNRRAHRARESESGSGLD